MDQDADHLDYALSFRPDAGRFEKALVNFPGVWGLEAAVDLISRVDTARIERHLLDLTARLIEGVLARGYIVLSSRHEGERSGVVSFRHRTRSSEEIQQRLQAARTDVALCLGALRASPGIYSDGADVQALLDTLP